MTIYNDPITYWHKWPSNFTNIVNNQSTTIEGLGTFMQYINSEISGLLGIIIVILTFTISFLSLKNNSFEKAFAPAAFITAFIGILLVRIQLLEVGWAILLLVIVVVAGILLRGEAQRGV